MNIEPNPRNDRSRTHVLLRALRATKRTTARLSDLAHRLLIESRTDPLTGAPNRTALADRIPRWERQWKPRTIVFLDVDNFKALNDNDGHDAGDQALAALATVIDQYIRRSDFYCRWGGDEFVIVFSAISDDQIGVRLNAICQLFSELMQGRVSLSMGVSAWRRGEKFEAELQRTEAAMRSAKAAGKGRVSFDEVRS